MRRERLIRPTVQGLDLVGPIRRASVASGTECRMRRKTPYPAYGSVLGSCRPDKTRQRRIRQLNDRMRRERLIHPTVL
ncbi:ribonucleoside diphosphage reductase 1, beta subunit, B2 [Escherichia coli H454]|nr:ribonucleoside diphosphage reductase 1, beta subunit, B2 [Escherichia coli H454]